ncbi:MAG: hypothetical protein JNN01_01885 [Opitutaceae bacterium]|nr:hypothetical protein [Opitutaceae bacterium]
MPALDLPESLLEDRNLDARIRFRLQALRAFNLILKLLDLSVERALFPQRTFQGSPSEAELCTFGPQRLP